MRDQSNAQVFVVAIGESSAAGDDENSKLVGAGNEARIVAFKSWRAVELDAIGVLADRICEAVPEERRLATSAAHWPPPRVTLPPPSTAADETLDGVGARDCAAIDTELDVIVVLDSSDFNDDDFTKTLESVGTLVDESFDLAPDVVRVGFVVHR